MIMKLWIQTYQGLLKLMNKRDIFIIEKRGLVVQVSTQVSVCWVTHAGGRNSDLKVCTHFSKACSYL